MSETPWRHISSSLLQNMKHYHFHHHHHHHHRIHHLTHLTLLPCWCCCSELVSSTHKHFALPLQRKWSEGRRGGEAILITRPLLLLWILPGEDWFEHPAQSGMLTPFKCPCPLWDIYSLIRILTANGQCQYERKKTGAKHQNMFSSFFYFF